MNRRDRKQRVMAEINITPFTDVILVLLTIFMIATPLIFQSSIRVSLPETRSAKPIEDVVQASITITNEGVMYLDNAVVTRKEMKHKIRLLYRDNPALIIILRADKFVRFKDIVEALDALNELGIKNVNLASTNEE
ncbi:MAG TPA: biopolymer transporter ExbD [Patescibacteria group bacterium]|nr:biopolymer transporter ExbD [Patescibacteria group bacterium]